MKITCPKCGASDEVDMSKTPPGIVLLRCDNCGNSFRVTVSAKDIARCSSEFDTRGRWFSTCPYCGHRFQVDETKAVPNSIWLCPDCSRVVFLPAPPEKQKPQEQKDLKDFSILASEVIQSETLERLVETAEPEQGKLIVNGSSFVGVGKDNIVPPLSEKERYTAQFMVRVGNNEMGPVSFNVLEDWARAGIIGKDAMISKAGESNYFLAIQMPELSPIFLGEESVNVLEKVVSGEKTPTTVLTEGWVSGALGGIVAGAIFGILVVAGIAKPMGENSTILQVAVSLGVMAFLGSVLGVMISLSSLWIVEYPWTAQFSLIPSLFFSAILFGYLFFKGMEFMNASFISGIVFTIMFIAAYVGCLFHRALYEKY